MRVINVDVRAHACMRYRDGRKPRGVGEEGTPTKNRIEKMKIMFVGS